MGRGNFSQHTGSIALLWIGLLAPGFADARTQEGRTPELRTAVNTEVAAARRVAPELGVHVVELASGETVYSFNPDTPRILASNTKVVTTAAALDRLGPGFLYETEVLIRGEVRGGVLAGDLAVLGSGDPGFSGRDYYGDSFGPFRDWAAALRERGIDRVAGDLVLVAGLFDDETVHPDWPRDQLSRWYEAPVSALSFNDNCVLVKVSPDGSDGAAAMVETVPPLPIFRIESTARTTGRARDQWLRIDRDSNGDGSESLTVGGRVYRRTESVDQWVTVADPVRYFGSAVRAALAEEGVTIDGEVRRADTLDGGWRRVHIHFGDLLTALEVINKRSQNFYAESVLKLLGARLCDDGSWAGGVRAVTGFLADVGFSEGSYRLADGSGMSRNNRFTPAQMTVLLRHMFHHRWGSQYLGTFPYSGERGLKWARRLAEPPYRGNVIAKTGWLSGVSTLSGYAKARSGKVYAFSILCNSARTKWQAEKAQDRIVQALIDHG